MGTLSETRKQTFFSNNSALNEQTRQNTSRSYRYFNGRASYSSDSLNLFTAALNLYHNDRNQDFSRMDTRQGADGAPQQSFSDNGQANAQSNSVNAEFHYLHKLEEGTGHYIAMGYRYSDIPTSRNNSNLFSDQLNFPETGQLQNQNLDKRENTLQLDYVNPLWQLTIEAGLNASWRNQSAIYRQTLPADSGNYIFHQNIFAAYNKYTYHFDDWSFKGALSLEQANTNAYANQTSLLPDVSAALLASTSFTLIPTGVCRYSR